MRTLQPAALDNMAARAGNGHDSGRMKPASRNSAPKAGVIAIALSLNPELADAHNNRVVALGSLGELEEAEAHFLRALEIQPNYADAQANLTEVSELLKTARPR